MTHKQHPFMGSHRAVNQDIIEALQELNTLLDEEAQQQYDPEDKELWARVGNRIDTIDYQDQCQSEIKPINPAPQGSTQLELVAPRKLASTVPVYLSEEICQVVTSKLKEFGLPALSHTQLSDLSASILRKLKKNQA